MQEANTWQAAGGKQQAASSKRRAASSTQQAASSNHSLPTLTSIYHPEEAIAYQQQDQTAIACHDPLAPSSQAPPIMSSWQPAANTQQPHLPPAQHTGNTQHSKPTRQLQLFLKFYRPPNPTASEVAAHNKHHLTTTTSQPSTTSITQKKPYPTHVDMAKDMPTPGAGPST